MDSKSPLEMSARRRRSHITAQPQQQQKQSQQHQQRRKAAQQERAAGSRSKAAAKQAPQLSKTRANNMTIAVVPPSRQGGSSNINNNNNNNSNSNNSNSNSNGSSGAGKGKKHYRCTFGRELHREVQRPMQQQQQLQLQPPVTSRVAFGRTCPGMLTTMTMTHTSVATLMRRGSQKSRVDTPRPKPMQAAHEQLEMLLSRIEQDAAASGTIGTMATATTPPPRRRKPPPSKTVRRQMEHPPPVPTVTPLSSARGQDTLGLTPRGGGFGELSLSYAGQARVDATGAAVAGVAEQLVPLTQNPQLLAPEKRLALLELLSCADQHDQEIVKVLRSEVHNGGDPSRDTMRLTLQMLPLALTPGKSPYSERFWAGHRYLKERQRLHQQLQPDDLRYKEVKILRSPNGKFFLSKTLEEELKDEKHVLDFIESELQRGPLTMPPEQQARQQKAMDERIELDRQKQQVSEWRARHRIVEHRRTEHQVTKRMLKKAKLMKRQKQEQAKREATRQRQRQPPLQLRQQAEETDKVAVRSNHHDIDDDAVFDLDIDLNNEATPDADQDADADEEEDDDATPRPVAAVEPTEDHEDDDDDELSDSLKQRQQFQMQCQHSRLYGSPKCLTPWTLFSNITNTLIGQLTANIDTELHRSIANFLRDFVDNDARLAKQTN
ncbi:putative uncharacterized protein DDB_G0271606 [Drosophila montana]|uniref:putative uncharacterized protein DDB_G0271606 n=1 Tax=Drosophila montana TaxID=40370 RepID=UPI00313B536B